jgi:hypothetical protein
MGSRREAINICWRIWHGGEVDDQVRAYVESVPSSRRRRDAATLVQLMQAVTGVQPRMWGTIVGFGQYHYRYASGREGDAPAAGFAARKSASTIYVPDGVGAQADLLAKLGPHSTGVGCIYIKDLEEVDLAVLEAIIGRSYAALTSGIYPNRARDSSGSEDKPR